MNQFVWEMHAMPSFELYARVLIPQSHLPRRPYGAFLIYGDRKTAAALRPLR